MATYKEITARVVKTDGFTPKSCWIAHVLSEHGLTKWQAYNRKSRTTRKYPCPPGRKRIAIETALRHNRMI